MVITYVRLQSERIEAELKEQEARVNGVLSELNTASNKRTQLRNALTQFNFDITKNSKSQVCF
jgi:chromosome condensin MukBEF ATPase and DNA-binding subunit MukB